ncbi:MAG: epoxyqueuosine reductase [Deltaproteobacteria bacterium]|nr:epoxyqueuosine reductase [Deltaproteobacteria bacterium]
MDKNVSISVDWVKELIQKFIAGSPLNTMGNDAGEPAWDSALVGFASGADPIWQQYKEYVGAFHWTPWEIFNQHCPGEKAVPEKLTVISWVLPQREMVRKTNRRARKYPSEEWARIRVYGEKFNVALRRHVVQSLEQAGHAAVAPMLTPNWTVVISERFSYASSWSERHAAHAAGLGTFGLSDGLITARGKAMRTGSIVAKVSIPPTPRPYADHQAYCLFYAGCGLCQVGVPCESGIPVKAAREALERGELPPPPPPLA